MNKIIGTILIIIGLILIGIGTYEEFNGINKTLISDGNNNYHDGLYVTSGDSISVSSLNDEVIRVIINNTDYEFVYNGEYYKDQKSGFYIYFSGDELVLYKDGEKIRSLYKK